MDCAACGKPISVTAKFCGKCGAPVKRPGKATPAEQAETTDSGPSSSESASQDTLTTASERVEDLAIQLAPTSVPALADQGLLHIDLNLEPVAVPVAAPLAGVQPHTEPHATAVFNDAEWLSRLEQQQAELKKTLEKHSLLLDFISLAAQQQSHHQSQPNPAENLLHDLLDKQGECANRLAQLQTQLNESTEQANAGPIPDAWKLLLEKQKVELQKAFATNATQITDNLNGAHAAELGRMQDMLKSHTAATESLTQQLAPMAVSVSDLKKQLQELSKKVDLQGLASRKGSDSGKSEDPESSSFMVFVIGLLCGLTLVLSSLAIYNFLGHSGASHANSDSHAPSTGDSADKAKDHSHEGH